MRSPVSGSLSEGIQFCTACLSPRRGEVSRSDGEGPPCLPLRGRWFRAARSPEPEGVVPFSRRGRRPRRLAKSLPRARGRWPRSAVIANQCSHWCGNPSILPRDEGVPFFCFVQKKGTKENDTREGKISFSPPPWTLPHSNDQTGLASPFWISPGIRTRSLCGGLASSTARCPPVVGGASRCASPSLPRTRGRGTAGGG